MDKVLEEKLEALRGRIRSCGSLAVAYSGGVDSTFLLAVAHEVLGDRAVAVTASKAAVPEREMEEAAAFCKERGIRQLLCGLDPMTIPAFRHNEPERCYYCKRGIFGEIIRIAEKEGIRAVAEGSNVDDLDDYRPGMNAVRELGVLSPLMEAQLSKVEIRELSHRMGLPTWSKPSFACLASRFATGEEITAEKLRMVERAERCLISRGFSAERVRVHGDLARIEVPAEDISRVAQEEVRAGICEAFRELGFRYVSLDLMGYRTGSMNAPVAGGADRKG